MALTRHSILSIQALGIPTIHYTELGEIEQLEEGKCYTVGILERSSLQYEQKCTTPDSCESYVKELQRVYGRDSRIYFYEFVSSDVVSLFTIKKKGQYELDSEVSEEDRELMYKWFDKMSENFDFLKEINGVVSRDDKGNLFISSIV